MNANPAGSANVDIGNPQAPAPEVAQLIVQLRRMIVDELDVGIKEEELTVDTPLLEGGLALDSIVLFELLSLVEKRFGFEFADQSLTTEVFANLRVLAQHIHSATAQRKQASAV